MHIGYIDSYSEELENELLAKRLELESNKRVQPHNCKKHLEMRFRVFEDGTRHKAEQCQICGIQVGQFYPLEEGEELKYFDPNISEERHAIFQEISSLNDRVYKNKYGEFKKDFDAESESNKYLEGLLETIQTILDSEYKNEIISSLRNIVQDTINEDRLAKKENSVLVKDVRDLKKWVFDNFEPYFKIKEGLTVANNKGEFYKPDFIMQAKDELKSLGFTHEPFIVVVSRIPIEDGFSGKAANSFAYASKLTEFWSERSSVSPAFVLLVNNFSFSEEYELIRESFFDNKKSEFNALSLAARHSGVALLDINGNIESSKSFNIRFLRGQYCNFYKSSPKDIPTLSVKKENFHVGLKVK